VSAPTTTAPLPDLAPLRRPAAARLAWLAVTLGVLVVLCLASVAFGVRSVGVDDILAALGGDTGDVSRAAVVARLPRTVLAVVVGAALGMSGTSMQAVTRNPLADPGILGVSSGAAFAVVLGIAFFGMSDPYAYMAVAVVGAAAAAAFVYTVGSLGGGGATPLKLALAGAAISAAFTSLTSAVLLPRIAVMESFRFWQIGGVGGATWDRTLAVLPVLGAGALVCLAAARGMNSLALGDDMAAALGEDVARTRLIASAGAVTLCGAATAVAGPIGFVGLVVPHLCRLLVGTDHRWLLPGSALVAAFALLLADVLGRVVIHPGEVGAGVMTALIGAPFFVVLVRRGRVVGL